VPRWSISPALRALFLTVVVLAGCASNGEVTAEPDTSTAPDSETASTTSTEEPTGDGDIAPSTTTTTTTASTDAVDDDQSPPTTQTNGLATTADSTVAPTDLTCERLENFGTDALDRWVVVNDGVMGGLSMGELGEGGGVASFSGTINTNGGGFSLIRTSIAEGDTTLAEALADTDYLRFRVRSANGRGYELIAEDRSSPSQVMHFAPIPVSTEGLWQEPLIPLADLEARAFGNQIAGTDTFVLDEVTSIGIILADGLDGPFSLEIDRIDACRL